MSNKSNNKDKDDSAKILSEGLDYAKSLFGAKTEPIKIDEAIAIFQSIILPMNLTAKEQKYEGNIYEKFLKKIEIMEEKVSDRLDILACKEPSDESPRYEFWEQKCEELEDLLYKYDKYKNALELIIEKSKK